MDKDISNKNNNGYIIKYYRIMDRSNVSISPDFDYYCWGWFDGIKVIKVNDFIDYQAQSISFDNFDELDRECYRQKLLIYNCVGITNNSIFDNKFYEKLPLLSVSIINFKKGINAKNSLDKYLKEAVKICNDKIETSVFGVLSANDCVVVCRSNNYLALKKMILAIRQYQYTCSVYSVFCLENNLGNLKNNWIEVNPVKALIKLSVNTDYNTKDLQDYVNSFNNKSLQLESSLLTGKKDCSVIYNIEPNKKSVYDFISFSFEKGFYNNCSEKTPVYSSSTDFLYDLTLLERIDFKKIEIQNYEDYNANKNNENEYYAKKYFEKYNAIIKNDLEGRLSDNFVYELNRLALRTYQLLSCSEKNGVISLDIIEGVLVFLKLTRSVSKNIDKNSDDWNKYNYYLKSIINGLISLNTLLDNREVNEFHDFEVPKSNMIFTGNCFKLIEFYSAFSRDVLLLLEKWGKETYSYNKKKNYFFLTTDGYSEVNIQRLYLSSEDIRLLNARIPTELLYTPYYTMCMLAHELGHFSKLGWDRITRNRFFTLSLISIFFKKIHEYNIKIDEMHFGYLFFGNYDHIGAYDCHFKKFTETIKKNFKVTLYSIVDDMYVNNGILESFVTNFSFVIDIIQDAYRESPADVFMVRALQIDNPVDYLKIATNYFVHMGYNCNKLGENIILRLAAVVCTIFINASNKIEILINHDSFREMLNEIIKNANLDDTYNEIFKESLKKTCNCIVEYYKYEHFCEACIALVNFLNYYVYNGVTKTSIEVFPEFSKYTEFIKANGRKDDFDKIIKLVEISQNKYKASDFINEII